MTQPFPTSPIVAGNTTTDATTVTGTITRAGRALGVLSFDLAATGDDVDWTFSGASSESGTLTLDRTQLENMGVLAQFANTVAAGSVTLGSITLTIDLTNVGATEGEGLEIRQPDSLSRVVTSWGQAFHCSSTVAFVGGSVVRTDVELGTNRMFVTKGGVLLGEVFENRPSADIEQQERYHSGVVPVVLDSGIAVMATDHNERIYIAAGATANDLPGATEYAFSPSGLDTTYLRVAADGDDVACLYRSATSTPSYQTTVGFGSNIFGTPSISTLYVNNSASFWHYPRGLFKLVDDSGNRLWGIFTQARWNNNKWGGASLGIYDPANNDMYNANGIDRTAANGTSVANAMVQDQYWWDSTSTYDTNDGAAGGCSLVAGNGVLGAGGQRYVCDDPHVEIIEWNGSTKQAAAIFTICDNSDTDPLAWGGSPYLRLCTQVGGTRTITPTTGADSLTTALGLTLLSYRVPVTFIQDPNDPDAVLMFLLAHQADGPMKAASDAGVGFYYEGFGGDKLMCRKISDWKDHTTAAQIIAAISTPAGWSDIDLDAVACSIKPIIGRAGEITIDIKAPLGSTKNRTMQPGMLWSPTLDLAFAASTGGGHRSRARYDRSR